MIGIIGAMDQEIDLFKEKMVNMHTVVKASTTYYSGVFENENIVLCKSGVGKVNAGICTQVLIDQFQASIVIFTGVAGALNPALEIGDVVISKDCQYHDLDATALGFQWGEIPFSEKSVFSADPELIRLAFQASEQVGGGKTMKGRVLSGDQFIANPILAKRLHKELQGDCTEMEGAAVGHVCSLNQIPFVIVRSISDQADGEANSNFLEFMNLAAKRSFEIVSHMLK